MKVADFDYQLNSRLIAKFPPSVRGQSRLLVMSRTNGDLVDDQYSHIPNWLKTGDVLVINQTKVIKARLMTTRTDGAKRELIVLEQHGQSDNWYQHHVMYRGKLHVNDILELDAVNLKVTKLLGNGIAEISCRQNILELTKRYGKVPLPPYLHRAATPADEDRYQTIWASQEGSVAAPTASLNMTEEILQRLVDKGVKLAYLTLHVGLGTFMPIRTTNLHDHTMHLEYFQIPLATVKLIKQAKSNHRRVVALGTTVSRSLEYSADLLSRPASHDITGEADIFIYPGYTFKIVDSLITNFHAPKSTVLMLAAAFGGTDFLKTAYQHAIDNGYSFLSYGDSMLIQS